MTKDILEKLLEQTVLFFLSGIINEYDDVLSIEQEGYSLPPIVRVTKSIELLRNVIG